MKLYIAGVYDTISPDRLPQFWQWVGTGHPPLLENFFTRKSVERAIREGTNDLFLDSGAFSAFTRNVTIDIQQLIDFALENERAITAVAALDVIGDPEATWKNIKRMEEAGVRVVPVFHFGSSFSYLSECLKYPYMALGGLVPHARSPEQLTSWLDRCWSRMVDKKGKALTRVHGFGMTGIRIMRRYPWHSVDSTSWLIGGRTGSIFIPLPDAKDIRAVCVADNSPSLKDQDAHYKTLSPAWQDFIRYSIETIGKDVGIDINLLIENHWARRAWNIRVQQWWANECLITKGYKHERIDLFD